jgi:hypothetical protein
VRDIRNLFYGYCADDCQRVLDLPKNKEKGSLLEYSKPLYDLGLELLEEVEEFMGAVQCMEGGMAEYPIFDKEDNVTYKPINQHIDDELSDIINVAVRIKSIRNSLKLRENRRKKNE